MLELDYIKKRLSTLKTNAQILASELSNLRELEDQNSEKLRKNIREQNEVWFELVRQTLRENNLIYCRSCTKLQSEKDSKFLAIEVTKLSDSYDYFETSYNIFRFCKSCADQTIKRSPEYGKYNKSAEGQYYFSARIVSKTDDHWVLENTGGVLLEKPEQWYFGDDLFYNCGRCHNHLGGENNHELDHAVDLTVEKFSLPKPLEIESKPNYRQRLTLKETEKATA